MRGNAQGGLELMLMKYTDPPHAQPLRSGGEPQILNGADTAV